MHLPLISPSHVLRRLLGQESATLPMWMMRQAGRYLPEYREVRKQGGTFLDLCYDPARASEVTLQPIERFDFDGAILFCDILVVADILGYAVRFQEGEGPKITPVRQTSDLQHRHQTPLDQDSRLQAITEAAARCRAQLPPEKALLGFCGTPFTVGFYIVEGGASRDAFHIRRMAHEQPELLRALLDEIATANCHFLDAQIRGGVQAVQLFESLGTHVNHRDFAHVIIEPLRKVVDHLRNNHPEVPIILYGNRLGYGLEQMAKEIHPNAISVDQFQSIANVAARFPSLAVQGNLDPMALCAGGDALDRHLDALLEEMQPFVDRWIVNLGHGILKETPIAHVEKFVARIRATQTSKETKPK